MSQDRNWARYLDRVREIHPLVHHITNYVTVNDCANATLAIGGSPVMADAVEEAADMAALAEAVVLNIGTLNRGKVDAMILAGRAAKEKKIPVVFDPVGAGATPFRSEMAEKILREVVPDVIRGNISEVRALLGEAAETRGVDAAEADEGADRVNLAKAAARQFHAVVAVTGAVDVISDGERTFEIRNGCEAMARVTGTGCMCSSLIGAFVGANENTLEATAAAVAAMGLAGEMAWNKEGAKRLGHFHMGILDALGEMTGEDLERGAKIDEID